MMPRVSTVYAVLTSSSTKQRHIELNLGSALAKCSVSSTKGQLSDLLERGRSCTSEATDRVLLLRISLVITPDLPRLSRVVLINLRASCQQGSLGKYNVCVRQSMPHVRLASRSVGLSELGFLNLGSLPSF